MPYAPPFRAAGPPTVVPSPPARNDQASLAAERRPCRRDAVFEAIAESLRTRLREASLNGNIPRERAARRAAAAGPSRPDRGGPARRADPDEDILALIDRGEAERAIELLFQRHGNAVRRYCREELRDAALADDVHQQVFIEAFRDLASFQRRATMKFWLLAIARHRVLDAVKKQRSAQNYFTYGGAAADAVLDDGATPAEALDDARLLAALTAAVSELPEAARTALLLHFLYGFTFAEIAKLRRERSGTLCARVTRALPVLRRRIEARLGGVRWQPSPECRLK